MRAVNEIFNKINLYKNTTSFVNIFNNGSCVLAQTQFNYQTLQRFEVVMSRREMRVMNNITKDATFIKIITTRFYSAPYFSTTAENLINKITCVR